MNETSSSMHLTDILIVDIVLLNLREILYPQPITIKESKIYEMLLKKLGRAKYPWQDISNY